jgi:chromosome segregation ATPase
MSGPSDTSNTTSGRADDRESKLRDLDARLSALAAAYGRHQADDATHAATLRRLDDQLGQLLEDRERLTLEIDAQLTEIRALHQRLAAMKLERDRFASESAERQSWLRELEARIGALSAERDAARHQRDALADQLAEIRGHPLVRVLRLRHRLRARRA